MIAHPLHPGLLTKRQFKPEGHALSLKHMLIYEKKNTEPQNYCEAYEN